MRHLSARINVPDVVVKKMNIMNAKSNKNYPRFDERRDRIEPVAAGEIKYSRCVAKVEWEKLSQDAHRTNVSNDKFSISKFDS